MFAPRVATTQTRGDAGSTSRFGQRTSRQASNEHDSDHEREIVRENLIDPAPERHLAWDFGKIPLFAPDQASRSQASYPSPGIVQRKLTVGAVNDPLEHEADRIADRVMRMPDPDMSVAAAPPQVSRECAACEEEEKLRRKPSGRTPAEAPGIVHEVLASGGQALDVASRAFFEPRFGHDFSRVRTYADERAGDSARALGALAYTVGSNIAFAPGRFSPSSAGGRFLLAHELAHVLQQQSGLVLQRQVANPASAKDQPELVRDTIHFLEQSVGFFQLAKVDDATFDRVINSWYATVVRQEQIIDADLQGDAALKADLHTAYISALRVLVKQHATASGQSETDLYRINSGRIPLWAQPHPSHLEPGVTTPIPDDVPVTHPRGRFQFSLNGFDIRISPDTRVRGQNDPGLTHPHVAWGGIQEQFHGTRGHGLLTVVSFTGPPKPVLTIFTSYRTGVDTATVSGYGRGTTAEDKAGAKVTPQSESLAFHESRHGQATLDFISSNPPPIFTGKVGDTEADFNNAVAKWQRDVIDYSDRMDKADTSQVHCVGFTIDQYHASRARPGQRIVKECP